MKILMTQTAPGSIDGIRVQQYEAGTEYDLSDSPGAMDLAQAFVGAGFATNADEVSPDGGADVDEQSTEATAKPGRKPKAK